MYILANLMITFCVKKAKISQEHCIQSASVATWHRRNVFIKRAPEAKSEMHETKKVPTMSLLKELSSPWVRFGPYMRPGSERTQCPV